MTKKTPEIHVRAGRKKKERRKVAPIFGWVSSSGSGQASGVGILKALAATNAGTLGLGVALVAAASLAAYQVPAWKQSAKVKRDRAAATAMARSGQSAAMRYSQNAPLLGPLPSHDSLDYTGHLRVTRPPVPGGGGAEDEGYEEDGMPEAPEGGSRIEHNLGGASGAAALGGGKKLGGMDFNKIKGGLARSMSAAGKPAAPLKGVSAIKKGTPPGQARATGKASGALKRGRQSRTKGSAPGMPLRPSKGALSQLKRTSKISRAGTAKPSGESAHATESQAFEDSGGAGESLSTTGSGGAVDGSPVGGSYGSSSAGRINNVKGTKQLNRAERDNVTPWQASIDRARTFMKYADVLFLIGAILARIGHPIAQAIAMVAIGFATMFSLMVAGMGASIYNTYGQKDQGQILMLMGGVAAAMGAMAMSGQKNRSTFAALAAASTIIIAAITGHLDTKNFGFK